MNTSRPGRRGALSLSAALVVVSLLLGACSSDGTTADAERAAAAPNSDVDSTEPDSTEPDSTEPDSTEPDSTEPDSTEPDSTEPDSTELPVPEVESGEFLKEPILATSGGEETTVMGVTLCVRNQSSLEANVVLNPDSGSGVQSRSLGRGDELCASGNAFIGKDISGSISVEGVGRVMDIEASRPALWLSWVEFIQPEFGRCLYNSYFQNGGSTVEDGVLRYAIKRGKDTDRTNFRITLTDPRKKSSNGEPTKCA